MEPRVCGLIAALNEERSVGSVVRGCREHLSHVVVVDDGSTDGTAREAERAGAVVFRQGVNRGKGAALQTGFDHALHEGYDAVITLDADGQHDPAEIPRFLDACRRGAGAIIIGSRLQNRHDIPWQRYWSNSLGVFVISRAAGQDIPDTQSGFRLYTREVMAMSLGHTGFEAETEILIRASRAGHRIHPIAVRAIYPEEYTSHFRPVRDFTRISLAVLKTLVRREK